jgi:predicted Rossmann fold flavoprotein
MSTYPPKATQSNVLAVIGGGAAGFFCAVNAARLNPSLRVVLLEKSNKLLSKVRISGGGRCNVTHALFDITEMSKRYPRGQNFVKKTFHRFFTKDTIEWFEKRGVKLKAEKDGRMFPVSDSSESIINCLMNEANIYGVDIRMNAAVKSISSKDEVWTIQLENGQQLSAGYVCVATGGYPKANMFQWLANLGHSFSSPVPSLFTFNLPGHPLSALMGISVEEARIKIEGSKLSEAGPVLITHWGLSGPAVLKLSAWGAKELAEKNYHFKAHINWCSGSNESDLKEVLKEMRSTQSSKKIYGHALFKLPARLWQFFLLKSGIPSEMRFADLPLKNENTLIRNLVDYVVEVKGKTTFKEEFVTAGGVNLQEVDANTMMSRKCNNLFFAGEVLDVDGITGGFNFQHAWTSAYIAAQSIAEGVQVHSS